MMMQTRSWYGVHTTTTNIHSVPDSSRSLPSFSIGGPFIPLVATCAGFETLKEEALFICRTFQRANQSGTLDTLVTLPDELAQRPFQGSRGHNRLLVRDTAHLSGGREGEVATLQASQRMVLPGFWADRLKASKTAKPGKPEQAERYQETFPCWQSESFLKLDFCRQISLTRQSTSRNTCRPSFYPVS